MSGSILDFFRPNRNAVRDCCVFNNDGACVSSTLTEDDAKQFAIKAVTGKLPHLVGMFEAYVMRCVPVARIRDKAMADATIEDLAVTGSVADDHDRVGELLEPLQLKAEREQKKLQRELKAATDD